MGDSGAYLYTALHGYIPHDRGFVYGFLLRPLAVWPHSLRFLVFAQATMSAISAWLIAVSLKDGFGVPFRWAALLSFLCAVEPLQLISERYILTDTVALFLFAVLITVTLSFCRHRTGIRLALALLAGVALIGIRISYLPIVLLNSLLLPFLWFRSRSVAAATGLDRRPFSAKSVRLAALFLLWLGVGQLLLYGYRYLNAAVSNMATPEYFYMDGFILLSDVAPIITADDFPSAIPGSQILTGAGATLRDPIYREAQLFAPNGLCSVIRRIVPDEYQANKLAKNIALHAIATHPLSFARLAIHTWAEYFHVSLLRAFLNLDEGGLRATDEPFREEIRASLGTDLSAQSSTGPVWRWHRAAIPWYWFLVLFPLGIPFLVLRERGRIDAPAALIYAYLMVLFAQTLCFSTHAIPRYLMASGWLSFLLFGVVSRARPWRRDAPVVSLSSQTPVAPAAPPVPVS